MFLRFSIVTILAITLSSSVKAFNASSGNFTGTNFSVVPPLTDFLDKSQLTALQNSAPQEQVEWINATSDEPWASFQQSPEEPRRARDLNRQLSRRYTDVTRCPDSRRRVILRNEVRVITQMILSAQTNLTLSHPVWQALISPAFGREPRALERMKGLLKVLYDIMIDSKDIVALGCNVNRPQCLQRREDPTTRKAQVPAAYYNLHENVVNLCGAFFALPKFENMECSDGRPMSAYMAMPSTLLHEVVHGIFEPLATTNFDFITFDLAYGFGACAELAQGTCDTAEAGIRCSPLATIANVDTMVWLVYGYYWYNTCTHQGLRIPLY